jgi:hypothetical protein
MTEALFTKLELYDGKRRPLWRVEKEFTVEYGPGLRVTVPKGYVTNFGTIPRWAYWWISPTELGVPAVVHDYMCGEVFDKNQMKWSKQYSRWLADAMLYESMRSLNIGTARRVSVFLAVRAYALWKGLK